LALALFSALVTNVGFLLRHRRAVAAADRFARLPIPPRRYNLRVIVR
jgi:hypothetical protein